MVFTKALDTLKHHFPNKKIGGPGFLVPTVFVIDGDVNNKATHLLKSLYYHQVKPDYISWHLWNLDPMKYYTAGENYRKLLDGTSPFDSVPWAGSDFFKDVEIHCGAWGTPKLNVPDWNVYLLYNKQKGAALLTADWIAMQETNTVRAYYYRGADPHSNPDTTLGDEGGSGIFYGDANATYKPKAYAFKLWSRLYNEFPQKLSCDFPVYNITPPPPGSPKLWVLPAKNSQNAYAFLVSNTDSTYKDFTVDISAVSSLALDTSNFNIYYYVVNDNENGDIEHQNYSADFAIGPQTVVLVRILPKNYSYVAGNKNTDNIKIFPNPSSKTVNILYKNSDNEQCNIKIYDTTGKLVETIFSGNLQQGEHNFVWNSSEKGIYFCVIKNSDNCSVKRIVID